MDSNLPRGRYRESRGSRHYQRTGEALSNPTASLMPFPLQTVGRILRSQKLKPWQHHLWPSAKVPRDAHFAHLVGILVELYTRPLTDKELVLCG